MVASATAIFDTSAGMNETEIFVCPLARNCRSDVTRASLSNTMMRSENKPIFRCCTTYVAQLADTLKTRSAVKGLFIHLRGGDDDADACGRARLQSFSCSRSPSPPFPRNSAHHPPPEPLPQTQQISWPPRDLNATADGCSHTLQSWGSCQTSAIHGSGSTCR